MTLLRTFVPKMINTVLLNWVAVTKGPNGVMLFSGIKLFGFAVKNPVSVYFVVAVVVALSIWVLHRLSHSYYGNALRSLREIRPGHFVFATDKEMEGYEKKLAEIENAKNQ